MKKYFFSFFFSLITGFSFAQYQSTLPAEAWVDSVFKKLNKNEKIAQLMVLRVSALVSRQPYKVAFYDTEVADAIRKYNVGAICLFQGEVSKQVGFINYFQSIAKTPLMVCIDAEYGLGMRLLDSVPRYPYQLTLGALEDSSIVYEYAQAVAAQCRRMGIHVNYAPVVDVNNNPNNPVIGFRSFGEDKYKVAEHGIQYMRGLQDGNVMACAKHFPGHGDTETDSHLDLPVINKSREQLDSLELYPFKKIFDAGISSVMVAHLYIPAIDNTPNRATSLSPNNINFLMRKELGYPGLSFTDALDMKGVAKFFPAGEAAAQSLIAGNDMLCLPSDIPGSIKKIKEAIKKKKLSWADIDEKVKKVLLAKYQYVIGNITPVDPTNIVNDLNTQTDPLRRKVAENVITLVKNDNANLLAKLNDKQAKIVYIGIGIKRDNSFAKRMREDYGAQILFPDPVSIDVQQLQAKYDVIVAGVHAYNFTPANNFGITAAQASLLNQLQTADNAITFYFGNPYAVKNSCQAKNLVVCYEDDDAFQHAAADFLTGRLSSKGKLPVTVCNFKFGTGITRLSNTFHSFSSAYGQLKIIDSIAYDAIAQKAFPGCVVLAARDGEIIYHKAFGNYQYEASPSVSLESIYDLASVTKISATTIAVMKLYEQGKLEIKNRLGDYLPLVKGTDKENLIIEDILLHQAGLNPFISFYKETIDSASGSPFLLLYTDKPKSGYSIRVAENLYLRNDWNDTMFKRILKSPLGPAPKYVYSDNDFIFLGKTVEAIAGLTLDEYVQKTFYNPMGLNTTGFKPRSRFTVNRLVPTEKEKHFRRQLIRGDVHDEGASMFGGVSGHAGLFSSSYDLAMLYQMLLSGGELNGERYLKPETIKYFTAYHSEISRRGLGFDKPEKDNSTRKEPYPCLSASQDTFGHTGFTGTCVWVDPKYNLVYIFLSNRVYPSRDNPRLSQMNVRTNIQEAIYNAITQKAF